MGLLDSLPSDDHAIKELVVLGWKVEAVYDHVRFQTTILVIGGSVKLTTITLADEMVHRLRVPEMIREAIRNKVLEAIYEVNMMILRAELHVMDTPEVQAWLRERQEESLCTGRFSPGLGPVGLDLRTKDEYDLAAAWFDPKRTDTEEGMAAPWAAPFVWAEDIGRVPAKVLFGTPDNTLIWCHQTRGSTARSFIEPFDRLAIARQVRDIIHSDDGDEAEGLAKFLAMDRERGPRL